MAANQTLNSRLRILVAKAYRSEKLYSSVNNSRSDRMSSAIALAETASDVRAKEWQRYYNQLRVAVNDLLSLGNSSQIARELFNLRDLFLSKSGESTELLKRGEAEVVECAYRHEFAHIFKCSVELIRLKAQAQVCQVIASEIGAVLEASGHSRPQVSGESEIDVAQAGSQSEPVTSQAGRTLKVDSASLDRVVDKLLGKSAGAQASNVIQLRRRVG